MSANLTDKVALVTGSTTGIGHGIAHNLARKGASVILTGLIEEDAIPALLAEFQGCPDYKGKFDFLPSDFSEFENVEVFSQQVLALYPDGIDILVNNAGVPGASLIEDLSSKVWKDTVAINLNAPFVLTRAFFPLMKGKGWGRIINMSSQLGQVGMIGKLAYCSTKSGLIGLSKIQTGVLQVFQSWAKLIKLVLLKPYLFKVVALEGAQFGVTCNAICPGFVDAPMSLGTMKKLAEQKNISFEDFKEDFLKDITPIGRLIPISEIVELVAFLCSEAASSITGSPVAIDGGYAIR